MCKPDNISGVDAQVPADLLAHLLPLTDKVVLVLDLVESVRLMNRDEPGTVTRWHDFVQQAQTRAIPAHHGRLVKSLGDGLMVEFANASDSVHAAFALHKTVQSVNVGLPTALQLHLRAGINSTHVYTDHLDIYGAGVNLAARIAALAGPGETVVSANTRDSLADGLDVEIDDLGDCYLKHLDLPVRAYRVTPVGRVPGFTGVASVRELALPVVQVPLQPAIAVIPFSSRRAEPELFAMGELIADAVIHQLGKSGALRVVSRLSTTHLRGRDSAVADAQSHLGADYVLSGSYLVQDARMVVSSELAEAATGRVVWTDRLQADSADLFQIDSAIGQNISQAACSALLSAEAHKATVLPLPNMQSYSLMLGAITLMHRATSAEFQRARDMLDRLRELHGRHAQPLAWLGMWYVLRVAQGWSDDPQRDASEALDCCQRALDRDSRSTLAIAITGQVHGYLKKDLETATRMYNDALAVNPSESLAWLWLGMTAAFRGDGPLALEATERALALSPLDPLRYYYQALAASAAVTGGRYASAIELANASIRTNRTHSSTYRSKAIAQVLSGQTAAARHTVAQLLQLEPRFNLRVFLERFPAARDAPAHARMLADALRAAGLPE